MTKTTLISTQLMIATANIYRNVDKNRVWLVLRWDQSTK